MAPPTAELLLDARAEHGEGPIWDERAGWLAWVDITGRVVHLTDPTTGDDVAIELDQEVGAVALREDGGLVLAVEQGLVLWSADQLPAPGDADPPPRTVDVVVDIEHDDPATRANDGAADPHGRYWIGTMAHADTPGAGSLYRVDPDHSVRTVLSDLTISNGIAWQRDGAAAWFIDTPEERVDRLVVDPETGELLDRVPVIDLSDAPGVPDGMTIDVDGGLWIAMWGGWQVRRHAPDGSLDVVVEVPVEHVTACVHGGADLRDLYITTSRRDLDDEGRGTSPHAGSVFRFEVDVPGHPPDRVAF